MNGSLTVESSAAEITAYIKQALVAGLDASLAGLEPLAEAHLERAGLALALLRKAHPAADIDLPAVTAEWEASHV